MSKIEIYKWPIEPKYKVIEHDKYGMRAVHQILKKPRFHSGFDITAETCTPVRPASVGTVVYADLDPKIKAGLCPWNHRYGNMVEIIDTYGRKCIYAHLREISCKVGDEVSFDDVIALSGCSGGSRIPHLHFEIRDDDLNHSGEENTVNPLILLPEFDFDSLTEEFKEEPYADFWKKSLDASWQYTDDDIPYANNKMLIR